MNPVTRQEMFLNAAAGNEQALPDPVTREEVFLKAIVDAQSSGGGGGGSGGGGVLLVTADPSTGALDKTWQDIFDADVAVIVVQSTNSKTKLFVSGVAKILEDIPYIVDAVGGNNGSAMCYTFSTATASGYPVLQQSGDYEH